MSEEQPTHLRPWSTITDSQLRDYRDLYSAVAEWRWADHRLNERPEDRLKEVFDRMFAKRAQFLRGDLP